MRFQLTREFYIPKHATKVTSKRSSAIVYLFGDTKPCAEGFAGKAAKPAFHYSFRDEQRRALFVAKWIADQDNRESHRLANVQIKAVKIAAFFMPYKVGDVLYSSWGYDQTNVDYYEVTAILGKRTIEVRKIAGRILESGRGSERVTAERGRYIGETTRHVVSLYGHVKISDCQTAYAWDGESKHQTPFGEGH